jgi:hypothetical protein
VSEFDLCVNTQFDHFSHFFRLNVGLSDGGIPVPDYLWIGDYSNSYAIQIADFFDYNCWLAGQRKQLELPVGAIRPSWKRNGINVLGCGLLFDSEDKLAIFFTLNGRLLGELALEALRINKIN